MPEYIYMWAYIQKYPQETKRLLGIEYQKLLELIAYGKLLKKEFEKSKTTLIKAGGGNKPKLFRGGANSFNASLLKALSDL